MRILRSALVADVHPEFRRYIRPLLEEMAVRIHEAETRGETLRIAREQEPDLVLLDVLLDGPALAREIKAEFPSSHVVLMTGHGEEAYLSATGRTGSDAVLPKAHLRRHLVPLVMSMIRGTPPPWDGYERRQPNHEGWIGPERRYPRNVRM